MGNKARSSLRLVEFKGEPLPQKRINGSNPLTTKTGINQQVVLGMAGTARASGNAGPRPALRRPARKKKNTDVTVSRRVFGQNKQGLHEVTTPHKNPAQITWRGAHENPAKIGKLGEHLTEFNHGTGPKRQTQSPLLFGRVLDVLLLFHRPRAQPWAEEVVRHVLIVLPFVYFI